MFQTLVGVYRHIVCSPLPHYLHQIKGFRAPSVDGYEIMMSIRGSLPCAEISCKLPWLGYKLGTLWKLGCAAPIFIHAFVRHPAGARQNNSVTFCSFPFQFLDFFSRTSKGGIPAPLGREMTARAPQLSREISFKPIQRGNPHHRRRRRRRRLLLDLSRAGTTATPTGA